MPFRFSFAHVLAFLLVVIAPVKTFAVIRDGGVDPSNLGQGGWLYVISTATNKLGNTVSSVTNEASMFGYLKSQGMNYVIIKAATSNQLWGSSGNVPIGSPNAQFKSNLVNIAHANGILVFASTRSWGNDIPGEIAVANYCFQQGADGFIIDGESEWESSQPWIGTNGPALAWQFCSGIRSNWPTKFLAHNPYDTLYLHSSFPFKEFGYWCDAVMPQVYHHSASRGNAIAAIHWTDINYKRFQDFLMTNAPSVINGQTIYWTNAIKPLVLMRDVYNGNAGTPVHPPSDVANFLDYLVADPNCVTAGGYQGSDYFRSELHSPAQWTNIAAATVGFFPGVVNNIILDDAKAIRTGTWTMVKTIDATINTVLFTGDTGTDTNSFGTNYWMKTQGVGLGYMQFNPTIVTPGEYNVLQWHPFRADASANVSVSVAFDGGTNTFGINQQTNNGAWTVMGKFWFAAGTNQYVRITDVVSGAATNVAMVDGLKMVFVMPTNLPAAPSGLAVSAVTTNAMILNWTDNSTNESGFLILRSTTNGGPYSPIGGSPRNVTTFNDTTVLGGATYYYVVQSTNFLGQSTNSNQATLPTAPVITGQPQSTNVAQYGTANFTVGAAGALPLNFQWKKQGTNLSNGGNVSGVNSATLVITNVTQLEAGAYTVTISNSLGSTSSVPANLTVFTIPPSILTHPLSQTINAGASTSLSVTVTGTPPLTLQWKKNGTNLLNVGNVSGVTNRILSLTSVLKTNQGGYTLFVSSPYGNATSSNAVLTVIDPVIDSHPEGQTVDAGTTVVFDVSATGTPTLNYQWKKNGTNLVNNSRISGATTPSLTVTSSLGADSGNYTALISNSITNVTSAVATLVVNDPIFLIQPESRTNQPGTTAVLAGLAFGTTPLSYQWKKDGTNLLNVGNITGATSTNLTMVNVSPDDQGIYTLVVSNSAGVTSSIPAVVTIGNSPPLITVQPTGTNVNAGGWAALAVVANGTRPLSFQWKLNGIKNVADNTNIFGATTSSLTMSNLLNAKEGNYTVVISNSLGSITSSIARVNVLDPVVTTQPGDQSVSIGGTAVFTAEASGTPFLSYQWKKNGINVVSDNRILGSTTPSLTITNVSPVDVGDYWLSVSNSVTNVSSAVVHLSVPFQILSVTVTSRPNGAVINWVTTSNSTSQVEYGLSTNYGYLSALSSSVGTNHSVLLTGLAPDTNYFCRVISRIGGTIIRSNATFFTTASVIVDNPAAIASGTFVTETSATNKYGANYLTSATTNVAATSSATFAPNIPVAGKYDVYTWYGNVTNRSTNVSITISGSSGSVVAPINQNLNAGSWRLLATSRDFASGTNGYARIGNNTGETNRVIVADAFLWKYNSTQDLLTNGAVPGWWSSYYFNTTNVNGQADADNDGYSTYSEYVLGTIPNDVTSRLDFRVQKIGSNTVQAVFSPCLTGRSYILQYKTNLASANWSTVGVSMVVSNGQGTVTITNVTQPAFYRLLTTITATP